MLISYANEEIRECCLLLGTQVVNSNFAADEIKELRSFIADLKAAPRLTDAPIKYNFKRDEGIVTIEYSSFRIIGKIISKYESPSEHLIERMKIIQILKIGLQIDFTEKINKYK